jgi:hypothetical protein
MSLRNWTEAIHIYDPDDTGKCQSGWYNDRGEWVSCGSRQKSSTLHDDLEADFRQKHDHGGGDCMCFEDPDGPSYFDAMTAYVKEAGR